MKKIVQEIPITPYQYRLYLFDDKHAFAKFCIDNGTTASYERLTSPADGGYCTCGDSHSLRALGIFTKPGDVDQTLVHELGHAVIEIFSAIGMEVTPKTSEAFCYLQDHLFTACRRALRQRIATGKYFR